MCDVVPISHRNDIRVASLIDIVRAIPMLGTALAGKQACDFSERFRRSRRRRPTMLHAEIGHYDTADCRLMARHEGGIWRLIIIGHALVARALGFEMCGKYPLRVRTTR